MPAARVRVRVGRRQRGSALLVAMIISLVLLLLVAGLFVYAGAEHRRASAQARELARNGCAEAGLQLARGYFSSNVKAWNTYLEDPQHYDPVSAKWMANGYGIAGTGFLGPGCTMPCKAMDLTNTAVVATMETTPPYNQLFFDLDGDGQKDVYIYIRDNEDEQPPAANDWTRDNDLNVIVGAVCISNTLVPRLQNGQVDTSKLTVESLLSYNSPQ